MKKKLLCTLLAAVMILGMFTACGSDKQAAEDGNAIKGEIVMTIWDNNMMDFVEQFDMVGKFKEKYPDADIEVEKIKDAAEYMDAMKMRASANQLPDIMFNKPYTLAEFKDYLVDLSDVKGLENNTLSDGYKVDGKVLGIPSTATYEYVYYWKDMFEEVGAEVPTTWGELQEVANKLQEHYGAEDPDFMAIAMGAKDEWPDYPFMEFMPALISGNGQNWNDMAKMDHPFDEGTDANIAYNRAYKLFTSGVFGKDPLGLGNDQAMNLFGQRKAGIIALGGWALQNIVAAADSTEQLGCFYMPVRETKDEPFRCIVQGDHFMSMTTHSKNPAVAHAFVEWFFSEDCYPDFIDFVSSATAMKNFPKDLDPILMQAEDLSKDKELVMYDGGGTDFLAVQNESGFDYKKLGSQMFLEDFDLDASLAELNEKWAAARAKLNIK